MTHPNVTVATDQRVAICAVCAASAAPHGHALALSRLPISREDKLYTHTHIYIHSIRQRAATSHCSSSGRAQIKRHFHTTLLCSAEKKNNLSIHTMYEFACLICMGEKM